MSRLDYVTVGIVAVCLAALGFLVYKTVGLMNGNAETEPQANMDYVDPYPIDSTGKDTTSFTDPAFSSLDDSEVTTYSEEDDKSRDIVSDSKTTAKSGKEATKKTENVKPEVKKTETAPKTTEAKKPVETAKGTTSAKPKETTTVKPKVTTTTKPKVTTEPYFVQAGAFSARANAETLVKELKKLGYSDAKVEMTKSSAKALVVVDYFSSRSEADALKNTLKSKHNIEALVKQK
ncbi:MAG: SPOR domain-containing protein [Saprospiraceae bacterium]